MARKRKQLCRALQLVARAQTEKRLRCHLQHREGAEVERIIEHISRKFLPSEDRIENFPCGPDRSQALQAVGPRAKHQIAR